MNRREVLRHGTMTIPLLALGVNRAWAGDPSALPKVAESNPTAMALSYVHDALQSPKRLTDEQKTQYCDNCLHYGETDVDDWGTCAVIPGHLVAAKGWCMVWVAKPE